jgi:hypothetical protein
MSPIPRKLYELSGLLLLLIILSLQLFFSVRRESQTWDEANHIYAGYLSWTNRDFGLNPEHAEFQIRKVPDIESRLQALVGEQR